VFSIIPSCGETQINLSPDSHSWGSSYIPPILANGSLRVCVRQENKTFQLPLYQILPTNLDIRDLASAQCLSHLYKCRDSIAQGVQIEQVIGSDFIDVTAIVNPQALGDVHPFTQWIIHYFATFGIHNEINWPFKLATVYCWFHLMRVSATYTTINLNLSYTLFFCF
jgi:hypothetical protein